jgi:hypothetical protein
MVRRKLTIAHAADDEEHQRALEEQWMSGMTGQEEAVAGDAGGQLTPARSAKLD